MPTLEDSARAFLASDGIAVVGVSRDSRQAANHIYRKLRDTGRRVVAVNPRADTVEGDPCYRDLASVPDEIEAVMIVTPRNVTSDVVRQCGDRGVARVWIHSSVGQGSVSEDAVHLCRRHSIEVIAGACPMMFCEPVDGFHRCLRTVLRWFGKLPEPH